MNNNTNKKKNHLWWFRCGRKSSGCVQLCLCHFHCIVCKNLLFMIKFWVCQASYKKKKRPNHKVQKLFCRWLRRYLLQFNRTVFSICIHSFESQSNPVNFAFFPPVKSVLINKFSWTHTHNLQESFCVLFSHNNSKKVHWMQENNNFFYGWQWCSEIWLGLYVHCRITQPKLNLNWNRVCSNASRILTMSLNNYCV